ncbi:MAG: glutamate--tRNA ligase [Pseudomonadota bacterium]
MKPRVRFAPSPTGSLHIGGARTALFNWLFARHSGGTFILRVEDTDLERSTKEFEKSILDGMKWLGMDWDEGPYYQTQRMDLYKEHVGKLLGSGKAYRCSCTQEEIEAMRQKAMAVGGKPKYDGTCRGGQKHPDKPSVVRFKAPTDGATEFHDICRGTVRTENAELDDLIIARSDGSPTYNFTVVVDDVTMGITHVIRGDDHINNTPRQVLLYEALGFPAPEFAHLPMIHGPDKKKLSKRHGATSVIEYEKMGYLPDAMVNYLARLGWAHGDQEIFTREELIAKFDMPAVGSAASIFDAEKLGWVNSQHLLKLPNETLVELTRPFWSELGISIDDAAYAARAMATVRVRGDTLKKLAELSAFYFRDAIEIDPKAAAKWLGGEYAARLKELHTKLASEEEFSEASLSKIFDAEIAKAGIKMTEIAQPVRVALTGGTASPGLFEVMAVLGKDRVLKRLGAVLLNPPPL